MCYTVQYMSRTKVTLCHGQANVYIMFGKSNHSQRYNLARISRKTGQKYSSIYNLHHHIHICECGEWSYCYNCIFTTKPPKTNVLLACSFFWPWNLLYCSVFAMDNNKPCDRYSKYVINMLYGSAVFFCFFWCLRTFPFGCHGLGQTSSYLLSFALHEIYEYKSLHFSFCCLLGKWISF